jgi:uncharacterized surface protein with fasciclin (FAS1) repeats
MHSQGIRRFRGSLALAAAFGLALNSAPMTASAHCGADHDAMKQAAKKAKMDIVDTAVSAGDFKTLVAAVKAAGLAEALKGDGPFTVFAPTDAAFAALPKGTVEDLLKPENRDKLTSILKYHVVSGRVTSGEALKAGRATTLQKGKIQIAAQKDGSAMVNEAKLVKTDIETTNGVIHVIDKVLIPSDRMSQMEQGEKAKGEASSATR